MKGTIILLTYSADNVSLSSACHIANCLNYLSDFVIMCNCNVICLRLIDCKAFYMLLIW